MATTTAANSNNINTTSSGMSTPPSSCSILIIGGGPSGAYSAACLAQEGFSVTLLEADKFPRYHVGESMLPSMRHFLRYIDVDDEFKAFGFALKYGASFKFNPGKREGFTNFVAGMPENYVWNVSRAEADELLLNRARKLGVQVFENHRITEVIFSNPITKSKAHDGSQSQSQETTDSTQSSNHHQQTQTQSQSQTQKLPIAAMYKNTTNGSTGQIKFDWLIDASGRNGVLSRALGLRKYNQSLKNVAFWGYWTGTEKYKHPQCAVQPPFFEALHDESGWAWFIPLQNGVTSIGVVMDEETSKKKRNNMEKKGDDNPLLQHYMRQFEHVPKIKSLISNGSLIEYSGGPKIRTGGDYSYSGTSYSGLNYRIVGDAGAFIDPFFSSGVHLALSSGLSAAATISAVIRSETTASQAAEWHNQRVGTSYTRFLMIVLSAYRQMRAQQLPVLADVDEDNFDRAFDLFRPVIQGEVDINKSLSEDTLQKTIDFCTQAFEPASLEDWHIEDRDNGSSLEDISNEEAKARAEKRAADVILAKKTLRAQDMFHIGNFVTDRFNGLAIRFEKGRLGLTI